MPFVKIGTENSADVEIHYNDHGSGKPIVLIHGYPLDGNSWERQEAVPLDNGYRCISYDRRGFGQSSKPTSGFDYDASTADLQALLDHFALDRDVVLAGSSMGSGGGHPLPGYVRVGGGQQGGADRCHPAVRPPDRRQPQARPGSGVPRHQAGDRRRSLCVLRRLLRQLLQHPTSSRRRDRRLGVAGKLPGRRRLVPGASAWQEQISLPKERQRPASGPAVEHARGHP